MKIVIDISENKYQNIKKAQNIFLTPLELIIKNGVALKNERQKGKWKGELGSKYHFCTYCNNCALLNDKGEEMLSNFCHNCGAEMEK